MVHFNLPDQGVLLDRPLWIVEVDNAANLWPEYQIRTLVLAHAALGDMEIHQ
jgi:hypothetical protein